MFKSLKSRGLTTGMTISISILLFAYYAQVLLQDNLKFSHEYGMKINSLSHSIDDLIKPINSLEVSLYQFLMSLEPQDRDDVYDKLDNLHAQIPQVTQHVIIDENPLLQIKVKKLIQLLQHLNFQIKNILQLSTEQRFPTMQLIVERMNPAIDTFNANIQIIERMMLNAEINFPREKTRELLHRLKYTWSQSQNNTRSLITSRTGLFGNPERALTSLGKKGQQYNTELKYLLDQLTAISRFGSNDPEFVNSIAQLTQAMEMRLNTLKLLKEGLAENDWRKDKSILDNEIRPAFESLIKEISQIEQITNKLAATNLGYSQYASEQLSSFLWLLAFIFMALVLATYLAFEHWIRIPIERVAKAMQSEASQMRPKPLKQTGAIEIDYLIDAFEMMRTQIRLRQQRISSILQNAGEGIVLVNNRQRIDAFNQAAERIFHVSHRLVLDRHFLELFDQSNEETMHKIIANLEDLKNKNHQYLCTGIRPDGSEFPVDLTISNMKLDDQLYNILVMRDATERIKNEFDLIQARLDAEAMQELLVEQLQQQDASLNELRQTQKQLVESEKMASLAGLVAGVAHEINTPVGIGVTASSHLESELAVIENKFNAGSISAEDLGEYIQDAKSATQIIQNNLQRAATLIRGFKQVAVDQSSEERRSFNLHEYLDEIILNLHPKLKKTGHQVHVDVAEDIMVNSIPGALSQILTNLIINSLLHAFDDETAGNIHISAVIDDNMLELTYRDDGKGMVDEDRERIFEPFFTTRRGSGGSGLGMHITYNLVTATLLGSIQCFSEPEQGTRFIIRFPASSEAQVQGASVATA